MVISGILFPQNVQDWDVSVLAWIQNHLVNPFCDAFFSFVTHFGDAGIFWICCALAFLVVGIIGVNSKKVPLEKKPMFKNAMKTGIMMGVALVLGLILGNGLLKNLFDRARPWTLEGALRTKDMILVKVPKDASFPSGHTLASFEASITLCFNNRKFGIPAIILAVLVAFSRLYLYIHFPTDIIGGFVLAVINSILAIIIVNMIFKAVERKKAANTL